jgi:DNA-binding XRE family transcriptional regulator
MIPPNKPPLLLPPKPRHKFTVCKLAGEYASALLGVELKYKPFITGIPNGAMTRTEDLVIERVKAMGGVHFSVLYHATEKEIRTAASVAMNRLMTVRKQAGLLPAPAGYKEPTGGEELKALRREANLKIKELATLVGLTPKSVYRHESDSTTIRANNTASYERVLSDILKRPISLRKVTIPSKKSRR